MDVVSLAPSATVTIRAMGAEDALLAATDHCPGAHESVGGWLTPDLERVAALDPTVAVTTDALQAELRDDLRDRGVEVVHLEPETLEGVYGAVETVGEVVGAPERGEGLATLMLERVAAVRAAVPEERPVVYCEEWPEPPMAAGNWVPDAVRAAGGAYPFVESGARSQEVDPDTVAAADPERVVLHYCGRGTDGDADAFRERWDIDAAVHVLHDDLLNQPSPRLVVGVERLAELLHGVETPDLSVEASFRQ